MAQTMARLLLGGGSACDSAGGSGCGSAVGGLWLGLRLGLWVGLWMLVGGWSRGSSPASGRLADYASCNNKNTDV
mgnify:CR=1 FL=1